MVRYINQFYSDLPVAVITAHGTPENAVAALKAGAFDYLSKPVGLKEVRDLVKSALSIPTQGQSYPNQRTLLGNSPPMHQLRATIDKLARSQAAVYINGESGSGNDRRALHQNGR